MNSRTASLLAAATVALNSIGATPSPDQLLSSDTLAVFTVPDYPAAKSAMGQSPGALLWSDPALKPFRDKFMAKVRTDFLDPLEKQFGVKFSEYAGLARGQVTFALTFNGWGQTPGAEPGVLLLIDARDKGDVLRTNLAGLKRKWVEGGQQLKNEKIRDVDFSVLVFNTDDLAKAIDKVFPDPTAGYETLEAPKSKKPGVKKELLIGQSDTLLILGSSPKDIEKILIRQTGGASPSLAEQPSFSVAYSSQFREALGYGWINLKGLFDTLLKLAGANSPDGQSNRTSGMPQADKILGALGLTGLDSLSVGVRNQPEGMQVNAFLRVPESARKGLARVLAVEAKDSSPPPFVPAEAVKFSRLRLDFQKAVATIESMLGDASPQFAGVIKLLVDNAGKDKDANFDLRRDLFGNLGDDLISFQRNPRKMTLADLNSPPSLVLLSSGKPEQLASALKALASLLPQQSAKLKEREFLGRKVYAMGLPPATVPGSSKPVERTLSFSGSGGYVAISTDAAMIEEYLRSSAGTGKSLRENPALAQAADKVGGFGTGVFGYENQAETTRVALEILKKESGTIANLFSGSPLAGRLGISEGDSKFNDWLDFSLLPSFDKIAKYFYVTVWAGSATAEGIGLKFFSPTPPGLRQ